MLKKISITVMAFMLLLVPFCFADNKVDSDRKSVGIFLEAPAAYANNEKAKELISQKAQELFPTLKFNILPMEKTQMQLRTYREDNREISSNDYPKLLDRKDIQKISKASGCDYALFISINNSQPKFGEELFRTSFHATIICSVRLLDVETGTYIVSEQMIKNGESTIALEGIPSFEEDYNDALNKSLDKIKIDTVVL